MESERLKTYVVGLDERMQGGIPPNFIVLICGRAGTMKSSLGYSILHNHAKNGRKCVYLTLEQNRKQFLKHVANLGLTGDVIVKDIEDVVVIDLGKVRKEALTLERTNIDWLHSILNTIKSYKKTFGCELLVLDSLSALYSLTQFKNPRAELFYFFEKLREFGITTFLISEMPAGTESFGIYNVEDFLADGILHLNIEKIGRQVNLYLGVVKMRETKHDRSYYPLIYESGKFEIVTD